jgi:hypothetical protein
VSFLRRIRAWWNKDNLELAEEETRMTPLERDVDKQDFEARKDDVAVRRDTRTEDVDFESDSEPPRDP